MPRESHQLFVAGMTFIVDADDALRAHGPAVGVGKPATGLLDPDHWRGGRGPHAVFDPVSDPFAAARRPGLAERIGPDRTRRLDQLGEFGAANECFHGDVGEDGGRIIAPGDGVSREVPDESRLP